MAAYQFRDAVKFNQDIGEWDASAVTDMSNMVRIFAVQTNASCH
jgi:hypothetical protein